MSQVPLRTREKLLDRSRGSCELCGRRRATNIHHRQPRGMGGTSRLDIHALYNLLHICGSGTTGCHGYVEKERRLAYDMGWLVSQWGDPALVQVKLPGGWVFLLSNGAYALAQPLLNF